MLAVSCSLHNLIPSQVSQVAYWSFPNKHYTSLLNAAAQTGGGANTAVDSSPLLFGYFHLQSADIAFKIGIEHFKNVNDSRRIKRLDLVLIFYRISMQNPYDEAYSCIYR